MSDAFTFSAKTARAGDEVLLEVNGDPYRAVVMLSGGWTRSENWTTYRPAGPAYWHEKRSQWCDMIRGSGAWVAFAVSQVSYGTDPSIEPTSWEPMFATAGRVMNTWAAHAQHLRVQYAAQKISKRAYEMKDATVKAAMRHIIDAMYGTQEGGVVYAEARSFAHKNDVDVTGDVLRIKGDALSKLAEVVRRDDSSPLITQIHQQQALIIEMTRKLEAADEKINALRFILNR